VCESTENRKWHLSGNLTTCNILQSSIESTGIQFFKNNDAVKGLNFNSNKNILYLPENVDEKFPNLVEYDAYSCCVTQIARKNFKGLNKLRAIFLGHNQIEEIAGGSFADLVLLEIVWLGEKLECLFI
jgi:hypothetical protein